jgi:hypothetical protein
MVDWDVEIINTDTLRVYMEDGSVTNIQLWADDDGGLHIGNVIVTVYPTNLTVKGAKGTINGARAWGIDE